MKFLDDIRGCRVDFDVNLRHEVITIFIGVGVCAADVS